jgi:hypothetical protein
MFASSFLEGNEPHVFLGESIPYCKSPWEFSPQEEEVEEHNQEHCVANVVHSQPTEQANFRKLS